MKRIVYLAVLILALGLSACSKKDAAKEKVRAEVEAFQSRIPFDMGSAGSMTSMVYDMDDNVVEAVMSLSDNNVVDVNFMKNNKQVVKTNVLLSLAENREFLDVMKDAEACMRYVYVSSDGQTAELFFTPDDFAKCDEMRNMSERERARTIVDNNIVVQNQRCPWSIDEYTVCEKIYLDGDALTYLYTILETDQVKASMLQSNYDAFRQAILQGLSSDLTAHQEMAVVRQAGYDVKYIYVGDHTGEKVEVEFANAELPR